MSDHKQARDEFEDYIGWKPPRWEHGCNGGTYYEPSVESRWQDFLQGWTRRTQPEATKPAQDPRPLFDRKLADLQQRGYEIIGRILHKDGEYALFDSSCRWLTKPQYQRLMHEQDGSLFASPADALVAGDSAAMKTQLNQIGKSIGYGRAIQMLGQLWDDMLQAHYGIAARHQESMFRRDDIERIEAGLPIGRKVVYFQKRGRREQITAWMPIDAEIHNVARIVSDTPLYGRAQPEANADAKDAERLACLKDVSTVELALEITLRNGPRFKCMGCKTFHNGPGKWDTCPSCGRKGYLCGSFDNDPESSEWKDWENRCIATARQATPTPDAPQAKGSEMGDA